MGELPTETPVHVSTTAPVAAMGNMNLNGGNNTRDTYPSATNEKANLYNHTPTPVQQPPPAYNPPPAAPTPAVLTYATSLYPYNGTDAGDLSLQTNDRVAVTEYMNAEWWKGRNERTGQEGIFPRSYIRVEEKSLPPPSGPGSYGNMPMQVSQGGDQAPPADPNKKSTASKLGGKLGNAAIFGAGATIGSNIVNSIF
jgi:hypothetical protein